MVENINTPFDALGEEKLHQLVEAFYKRVGQHPELVPIFPDDLTETIRKQKQFLTQFLGGPPLYTSEHGHPMLRARHLPFAITMTRAKAWLSCMEDAMNEVELDIRLKEGFLERLTLTAQHMVNTPEKDELEGDDK
ncbi:MULTISPECIES: globin domain-containing protein [Cytobacillus]|uniref:Globin n=1 Tax=Cytobacillus stercorigallinarum TaxID=2762240 RepID=A0ABR8QRC1_9BACI|nr:globin [Cytobacillus stercorigallinarum]MBD7938091.1 globin [Cytobacillus stercorigallinarum]